MYRDDYGLFGIAVAVGLVVIALVAIALPLFLLYAVIHLLTGWTI